MASVTIRDIHKKFGESHILRGVSVDIADGEFVILVGPSGCGKSTLLRTIAGLETVTSGEIRIGERVVNDVSPKDRDIAMVFQSYALYPHMTIFENMAFALSLRKAPQGGDPAACRTCGADPRPDPSSRALSAPTLRRPAPARRDGARHRA